MYGHLPPGNGSEPEQPTAPAEAAASGGAGEKREDRLGREVDTILNEAVDLGEAVLRALQTLRSFLPFEAAAARWCRDGQESVWITSSAPLSMRAAQQLIDATAGCLRETGRHDECIPGPLDVSTENLGLPPQRALSSVSCTLLPEAGMDGCIAVASDRAFDEGEEQRLASFAEHAGPAFRRIAALDDALVARLRALVDAFDEGVALARDDLSVRPLNASAADILAALNGGRTPAHRLPHRDALARVVLDALTRGEPAETEIVLSNGDGPRTLQAVAIRFGPHEALVVLQDRSREAVLLERMLQSEKMASIGRLVSGVAHELNNPLTAVTGFTQILLTRDFDERTRRELRTILDEAERASGIVHNLLAYASQRPPEKTPVRINEMIGRVLALRTYDFRTAGIDIELDLDPNMPAIPADPDQLQQVLFNIITNAEQAILGAGDGGTIWVTSRLDDGALRIIVADSGPGIDPEHLSRIFDPFFTTKPVGEGTGLGLSICYGMIKAHGGRISVENKAGAGACFTIELPVEGEPQAKTSPAPDEPGLGVA